MSELAINMNKSGRPKKQLDKSLFEELCKIHCTKDEICGVLKADEKTVTRWCKDNYGLSFSYTYKKYSANGKMSLRRAQWRSALNGNTTMLVWLGKQELGQRDIKNTNQENEQSRVSFIMNYGDNHSELAQS